MCSTNSTLPQFLDLADLATTPQSGTQIGKGIHDWFNYSLSQKLKHPRVTLAGDDQVVKVRRAGSKSRHVGQIIIVDGHNRYLGRIDLEGVLYAARAMTVAVRELLEVFATNPREVAFRYGQLTGRCCFCNLALRDTRSLAHGYGQVCAGNWGLPWDANRKARGLQDSLYIELLIAKQEYESKVKR
jgi:hypothetical protein